MDASTISALYTGLKFAKDALNAALSYKIENESRAQINAALEKVGAAQDTLFEIREELFRLQSENEQLRGELKSRASWEEQKAKYQLARTAGGAIVYGFTQEPKHYACPSCFAKATIQILQDRGVLSGVYDCPGCKVIYPVDSRKPIPGDMTRAII